MSMANFGRCRRMSAFRDVIDLWVTLSFHGPGWLGYFTCCGGGASILHLGEFALEFGGLLILVAQPLSILDYQTLDLSATEPPLLLCYYLLASQHSIFDLSNSSAPQTQQARRNIRISPLQPSEKEPFLFHASISLLVGNPTSSLSSSLSPAPVSIDCICFPEIHFSACFLRFLFTALRAGMVTLHCHTKNDSRSLRSLRDEIIMIADCLFFFFFFFSFFNCSHTSNTCTPTCAAS